MKTARCALVVCAVLASAASARPSFSFNQVVGNGDTKGQPFSTGDGSGFFVHSAQDFGDGTPNPVRPLAGAIGSDPDLEWTTYYALDPLGPTRRSNAPDNQSDLFYLSRGVYAPGFVTRSASLVTITPGLGSLPGSASRRMDIATAGIFWGGAFFPGPTPTSGPSPEAGDLHGALLTRLTVKRGVVVSSSAVALFVEGLTHEFVLNGPAINVDESSVSYAVRSYLVAQVDIADDGFDLDGVPFGEADVYDVWLTQVPRIPAPPSSALFGSASALVLRRRRA